MSLVEQAIARMRNQANAAAAKVADAATTSSAPSSPVPPIVSRVAGTAKTATRIAIDRLALRANGYLAEEGKERQFADHFRRIKRPLIEKAFGWMKQTGGMRKSRLRGLAKVGWQFLMTAAAFNLWRLPKLQRAGL